MSRWAHNVREEPGAIPPPPPPPPLPPLPPDPPTASPLPPSAVGIAAGGSGGGYAGVRRALAVPKRPATVSDLFAQDSDEDEEEDADAASAAKRAKLPPQQQQPQALVSRQRPPAPPPPALEAETRTVADKLAEFVGKNGRSFEDLTRERNPGDTPFKWLFDRSSVAYKYYDGKVREVQARQAGSGGAQGAAATSAAAPVAARPPVAPPPLPSSTQRDAIGGGGSSGGSLASDVATAAAAAAAAASRYSHLDTSHTPQQQPPALPQQWQPQQLRHATASQGLQEPDQHSRGGRDPQPPTAPRRNRFSESPSLGGAPPAVSSSSSISAAAGNAGSAPAPSAGRVDSEAAARRALAAGDSLAAMQAYEALAAAKEQRRHHRGHHHGQAEEGDDGGEAPLQPPRRGASPTPPSASSPGRRVPASREALNETAFDRRRVTAVYKDTGERGHHMQDFIPPEELAKFMAKCGDRAAQARAALAEQQAAIPTDNIGHRLLSKMGWKAGEGIGASGAGITAPIERGGVKQDTLGLGAARSEEVAEGDDAFEQYRKRMMLGYKHRPNPLGNPRRPYY